MIAPCSARRAAWDSIGSGEGEYWFIGVIIGFVATVSAENVPRVGTRGRRCNRLSIETANEGIETGPSVASSVFNILPFFMRNPCRLFAQSLALAIVLPAVVFAAKADKKKADTPAETFAAMDKDGNGVLTQAEYTAAVKERLGDEGAAKRFAEMDKNADGKLSKEEFGVTAEQPKRKRKKKNVE
jgi:hypothetical protein